MGRDRAAAAVLLVLGGAIEARRLTIGDPGHPAVARTEASASMRFMKAPVAVIVQRVCAEHHISAWLRRLPQVLALC
jgi:hypothetical protein